MVRASQLFSKRRFYMARRITYPHADQHMVDRARMTASDFAAIQAQTEKVVSDHRAELAARDAEGGASLPPLCNTGGTIELVCENGEIKEVTKRAHSTSSQCFIDWVHVTCHELSFQWSQVPVSDDQVIAEISLVCEAIFGYGITEKRERGALFYSQSYTLGDKYGLVAMGGQQNTVLIQLNGEGCSAARIGWERRLHDFLETAVQPRITRLDLAHDDYEGEFHSPESVERAYDEGSFDVRGKRPDCEMRGNWKSPNGKGRTFYVGSRSCGKFFRGYEKGKQLGCPTSSWFRLEVEFKSVGRVIPHNALLEPERYFAAAYPYLENLSSEPVRIITVRKTVEASYERTKAWLRHQCGAALNVLYQIEGSAEKVLSLIVREGKIPRGVLPPSFLNVSDFIHHHEPSYAGLHSFD